MATTPRDSKHRGFPLDLFGWYIINRTIPHGDNQSVKYTATWSRHCGPTARRRDVVVRIEIDRNSYDFQSYARLQTLDPATLSWSTLCYLGRNEMAVLRKGERGVPVVPETRLGTETGSFAVFDAFVSDENALLLHATSLIDKAL